MWAVFISPAMGGALLLRAHVDTGVAVNPFGGDVLEPPWDYRIWRGSREEAERYAGLIANRWCDARVVPI